MNILIKPSSHLPQGKYKCLFSGILLFFLFSGFTSDLRAQRVALRTNLLEWGVASPNFGAEFPLGNNVSLECMASASPWHIKEDLYFRHIRFQPELKYWFQTLLSHHYIGVTAFYSYFDVGIGKKAFYGDAFAAGLTYGYHWILSRRWNLELAAGVGMLKYRMARYTPGTTHPAPNESGWTLAPVKLGVTFVYIIK